MTVTRILFVCHGNICRSPMAEVIMKDIVSKAGLEDCFEIVSRATSMEEYGNGIYPPARREIEAHGLPYDRCRTATLMRKEDYDKYDFIIGMDDRNIKNIRRIIGEDPDGKVFRLLDFTDSPDEIEDPWYTGNFRKVWNQIEDGCSALFAYLKANVL